MADTTTSSDDASKKEAIAAAEAVDVEDERGYVARWVGIESNPDVFTEFAHQAGLPKSWAFSDCLGLDEELLSFVPQPCLALILIFPWSREGVAKRDAAMAPRNCESPPKGLYYMEQRVGEACGTIAIIHAILNNVDRVGLKEGPLYDFYQQTRDLDKRAKGIALAHCKPIEELHAHKCQEGQSEVKESTEYHFVCFVCHENKIYELDGSRPTKLPICHGDSSPETFLNDAARVIKETFFSGSDTIAFAITTLGPAQD